MKKSSIKKSRIFIQDEFLLQKRYCPRRTCPEVGVHPLGPLIEHLRSFHRASEKDITDWLEDIYREEFLHPKAISCS